ncbi:MAG TPA: alpha/beta fold hydrolase [Candidatus Nitrosocosmicus sp.]|nr:alpha/beta fold hydrolase [Candidatus Nitrosocosmicus sp.]
MLPHILIVFFISCILFFVYAYFRLFQTLHKIIPENKIRKKDFSIQPEEIKFKSVDGISLQGWLFRKKNAKGTIIYIHGHGDPVGGKANDYKGVKVLLEDQYNLFMPDLRGFGTSDYSLHTLGHLEKNDILGAIQSIKKHHLLKGLPIYLLGSSMGAVSAIKAACNNSDIKALITIAPYRSLHSLFLAQIKKEGFPPYPFVWFMDLAAMVLISPFVHSQSAVKAIKHVHVPFLILQGEKDNWIGQKDYELIYKAANEPKQCIHIKNGVHNLFDSNAQEIKSIVFKFIKKL